MEKELNFKLKPWIHEGKSEFYVSDGVGGGEIFIDKIESFFLERFSSGEKEDFTPLEMTIEFDILDMFIELREMNGNFHDLSQREKHNILKLRDDFHRGAKILDDYIAGVGNE